MKDTVNNRQKHFNACNHKDVFANCKPEFCIKCDEETNEKSKPVDGFETYKIKYPHVCEKELKKEYEDRSGDLRHLRICTETGQWP